MSDPKDIKVHEDVPTTALAPVTRQQTVALARNIAGDMPPNKCLFHCMSCGDSKTLEFEPDEMEALGDDVRSYGGPCWKCGYMTLVPKGELFSNQKSIDQMAREKRAMEYREQADVLVTRVKEEFIGAVGGMAPPPPEDPESAAPPGAENLPDADTVSVDDLKAR